MKEYGFENRSDFSSISSKHFISYVIIVKLLHVSEPQLHNGIINVTQRNCYADRLRKWLKVSGTVSGIR